MNKIVILIILVLYIILCTLSILVFNDIFPIEVTVGGGGGGNDVFFNVSVVQGSSNILQIITKKQRRFVLTKPL